MTDLPMMRTLIQFAEICKFLKGDYQKQVWQIENPFSAITSLPWLRLREVQANRKNYSSSTSSWKPWR